MVVAALSLGRWAGIRMSSADAHLGGWFALFHWRVETISPQGSQSMRAIAHAAPWLTIVVGIAFAVSAGFAFLSVRHSSRRRGLASCARIAAGLAIVALACAWIGIAQATQGVVAELESHRADFESDAAFADLVHSIRTWIGPSFWAACFGTAALGVSALYGVPPRPRREA